MGQGNIAVHDRKRERYRCKICKRTFSAKRGTMFEGLRKPVELIVIVVTLLSYGCPIQAIVHAESVQSYPPAKQNRREKRLSQVGKIW
jgi:transposase-like protein